MLSELVIIDTSVIAHSIETIITQTGILDQRGEAALFGSTQQTTFDTKLVEAITIAQLGWVQSGQWLGELAGYVNPSIVWVFDSKDQFGCYWRNHYLKEYGIAYKAGRRNKTELFNVIMSTVVKTIDAKGWLKLRRQSFEADDIAAALVRRNRQLGCPNYITLLTVDSDWCGLIGDDCRWLCSDVRWVPRVRHNLARLNLWARRRWGIELEQPSDLWNFKADDGDKSDSLPANSPLEVIDLLNPPELFDPLNSKAFLQELDVLLTSPKECVSIDGAKCKQYLKSKGCMVVVPRFLQDS